MLARTELVDGQNEQVVELRLALRDQRLAGLYVISFRQWQFWCPALWATSLRECCPGVFFFAFRGNAPNVTKSNAIIVALRSHQRTQLC
jgi:hypothetical protein